MNVLIVVMQFLGCIILGIIGTIIFMFLFFNLLHVIMKGISITSSFSSHTLNQRSTDMTKRNCTQNKAGYYESVIHPFLNVVFKVKARNHTSSVIQKSDNHQNNGASNSHLDSANGVIPEVCNNPTDDIIHNRHTGNISKGVNTCQPKKNDTGQPQIVE